VASLFLAVVAVSGIGLGLNALAINVNRALHDGQRPGLTVDVSKPLESAELPGMLSATLASYRSLMPGVPIRALRLRFFAGMPQGVVITGEAVARQLVFNVRTGGLARLYEPGYPDTDMPLGWEIGQLVKRIHRGDAFGMTGRAMALLAGLSLLYLSVSGAVLYIDAWRRRRQGGRSGLFWRQ
jgi:hypothetical protein